MEIALIALSATATDGEPSACWHQTCQCEDAAIFVTAFCCLTLDGKLCEIMLSFLLRVAAGNVLLGFAEIGPLQLLVCCEGLWRRVDSDLTMVHQVNAGSAASEPFESFFNQQDGAASFV
jgi:hypothetical protein